MAGLANLLWPTEGGGVSNLVWVLVLVPVFLLAYHRGWRGAATAAGTGMALIVGVEVVGILGSTPDVQWWVVGLGVAILAVAALGAGWIADRMYTLQEHERRLREVLPVGLIVHRGGEILYVNDVTSTFIGLEEINEAVGDSLFDYIEPTDRERVMDVLQELEADREVGIGPRTYRLLHKDGSSTPVACDSLPVRIEGQRAIQTIFWDVTDVSSKEGGEGREMATA